MSAPATAVRYEDEQGSRYYIHPATGEELLSVTTILGATEGKPWLQKWAAKLAAQYAVAHHDEVGKVIREEGRDAAVTLLKDQARLLRERKADAGSYVHAVIEALILWAASPEGRGSDIALPDLPEHLADADYDGQPLEQVVDWMVSGFLAFVSTFNPVFEAAEMAVYHRGLGVAGTLDSIIRLPNMALTADGRIVGAPRPLRLCVDAKTGKNLDVTVREQLAAYRRMREALMPLGEVASMPETDGAALLHLRPEHPDGFRLIPISPADDADAWNRFRRAVEVMKGRERIGSKPGKVAYPPLPDGSVPPVRLVDLDGEGYGRTLGPLRAAGLVTVSDVALMTADELLAVDGIGEKSIDVIRRMVADHGHSLAGDVVAEVA